MTGVKGIVFDYGGTIDTNGDHWFRVFCGIYDLSFKMMQDFELMRAAYIYAEAQMEREAALIKPDETFDDLAWRKVEHQFAYFKQQGRALDDDFKWRVADAAYDIAERNAKMEAAPVLRELAKQYPLALVSNFYGNLQAVLKDFEIADCFSVVIESAAVGIRKPDPEIFRLAIQRLGLLPEEVVVVGDSYSNDIAPAKLLGCKTISLVGQKWNDEEERLAELHADVVLDGFSKLPELLIKKS